MSACLCVYVISCRLCYDTIVDQVYVLVTETACGLSKHWWVRESLGILGHTDRPLSLRFRILLVAFRVCDPVYVMTCPTH